MSRLKLVCTILAGVVVLCTSCALGTVDEPVKFYGRVTDSSGSGLNGVTVRVYAAIDSTVVTTDSKGNYSLKVSAAGNFTLMYEQEGYAKLTKSSFLLGGEAQQVDVQLKTLSEEAFINFELQDVNFKNVGGIISARVLTNVNYEIESKPDFIQCMQNGDLITLQCDSNHSEAERSGKIILKAEYNLRDTLLVKQLAGPVLVLQNYFEKSVSGYVLTTPKAVFSREIDIVSVESDINNLTCQLSEDKKTILFKNAGLNLLSSNSIRLVVKASDNLPVVFLITLRMYPDRHPFTQRSRESSVFTSDNSYVWVYTSGMRGEEFQIQQFSTVDFKKHNLIRSDGSGIMSYNPYNNYLYIGKSVFFEDRYITEFHLYDANSGEFVRKLIIDYKGDPVSSLRFCRNGLGIMYAGQTLLYLDSKNGHEYGILPGSQNLYDSSHRESLIPDYVTTCDNYNYFVLYGQNTSGRFYAYSVNPETKQIRSLYSSTFMNCVASNASPYAFYFSSYDKKIISQHVPSGQLKTLEVNKEGIQNLAVVASGNEMPYLFCSDHSLYLPSLNKFFGFNYSGHSYYIDSSNDGELLLLNKDNTLYLFRGETLRTIQYLNN